MNYSASMIGSVIDVAGSKIWRGAFFEARVRSMDGSMGRKGGFLSGGSMEEGDCGVSK